MVVESSCILQSRIISFAQQSGSEVVCLEFVESIESKKHIHCCKTMSRFNKPVSYYLTRVVLLAVGAKLVSYAVMSYTKSKNDLLMVGIKKDDGKL